MKLLWQRKSSETLEVLRFSHRGGFCIVDQKSSAFVIDRLLAGKSSVVEAKERRSRFVLLPCMAGYKDVFARIYKAERLHDLAAAASIGSCS